MDRVFGHDEPGCELPIRGPTTQPGHSILAQRRQDLLLASSEDDRIVVRQLGPDDRCLRRTIELHDRLADTDPIFMAQTDGTQKPSPAPVAHQECAGYRA